MIDVGTEIDTVKSPVIKFSDWLEQQPSNRFCRGRTRDAVDGKMCAIGMYADFLGIPWSEIFDQVKNFYPSPVGGMEVGWTISIGVRTTAWMEDFWPFPYKQSQFGKIFDKTWHLNGFEAAREWAVKEFRGVGL